MFKLTKRIVMFQSIKDQVKQRMAEFINVDSEAVLRNTPTSKQRKYKNVEIAEDFKRID